MLALLAIVLVPLAVWILARLYGQDFAIAPGHIARIVSISTVLPLLAGLAVRAQLPSVAARIVAPVTILARALLMVGVLMLLVGRWQAIRAAAGDGTVVALAVFVAAALLAGHLVGGPEREHSVVLALSSAGRHPAIALSIAAANFPDERFGGTILLYLIVSALLGLPYVAWQRRHVAASIAAA